MDMETDGPEIQKTSLRKYTSKVLTESSLSAVSDIISTVSTPRKIFKTFVFMFCVTGFFYQGVTFLGYVFQYPTIVDVDIEHPEVIEVPAFTFCNNNGISRSKFCSGYPGRCKVADEEFCFNYPLYCATNKTLIPKKEYYDIVHNMTLNDFLEMGQDLKNFLVDMDNATRGHQVQGPFIRAKRLRGDGRMGCYSLHSLVDSPDYPYQIEKNDFIRQPVTTFKFDVEESEEFIPGRKSGMLFSIHSPFLAVNPTEKGIFMQPGKSYRIFFRMEKEVLLPYPFETDCLNYTAVWLKRNRTGPRMQEMCQHKCFLDVLIKYKNCTITFALYPTNKELRTCTLGEISEGNVGYTTAKNEFEICRMNCKDDCSKIKYSRTVYEGFTSDLLWGEENEKRKKLICVEVYLDDSEIITFRHRPQYLFVEVFSSIGGFVGVWLGISLVELTNFLESLFRILRYFLKRRNME